MKSIVQEYGTLSEFIDHLTQLDIDLVNADRQTAKELETLDSWLS